MAVKKPKGRTIEEILGDQATLILQLIQQVAEMREMSLRTRVDLERLEGCIRDMQGPLRDSLDLERQRLAKERDLEHRRVLGRLDSARPERIDAAVKQLDEAMALLRSQT